MSYLIMHCKGHNPSNPLRANSEMVKIMFAKISWHRIYGFFLPLQQRDQRRVSGFLLHGKKGPIQAKSLSLFEKDLIIIVRGKFLRISAKKIW